MKASEESLLIKIPRNKTALMQYLQLLVVHRHHWWCSGTISTEKLGAFSAKMAARYAITRTPRGRVYDRSRGRAALHLVVFPLSADRVAWWILSDDGKGGLNDPSSPDAHITRHAMTADGHINFADYVLHYAHKKDARKVTDARTGKEKLILKDQSTWTWKLSDSALNEVKASIETAASTFNYGAEGIGGGRPSGVLGILACQRSRPLFSGIRTQVIAIHKHAESVWGRVKNQWRGQHSALVLTDGGSGGELRSLKEIMSHHLPKMTRHPVFGEKPLLIRDLLAGVGSAASGDG